MKTNKILHAINNIDDELIERADKKTVRKKNMPWLKWALPAAACLVIAVIALPLIQRNSPKDDLASSQYSTADTGAGFAENETAAAPADGNAQNGATLPEPSLALGNEPETAACYIDVDEWVGLATADFMLNEQTFVNAESAESTGKQFQGIASDRMVFLTLSDLADYADAFVVIPKVHQTSPDGDNIQTAIAEYSQSIGAREGFSTSQWDDHTISTGSRILIRQRLIGGCTMDEPNNLVRKDGVYLLPVKFDPSFGAYVVVGDFDVLFELNDEGKIVSHSQYPELNKYDGKKFSALINDIRALYPDYNEVSALDLTFNNMMENILDSALSESGFANNSISPLSFKLALGMAYNGASLETADLLKNLFGKSPDELNDWAQSYLERAKAFDGKAPKDKYSPNEPELRIANSYWVRVGLEKEISKDFTNKLTNSYNAQSEKFNESPDPINKWVSKATNGKINDILSDIDPDVVAYLVNALYFNAQWIDDFNEAFTKPGKFTNLDGSKVKTDMLNGSADGYINTPEYVGMTKNLYGGFTFTAAMPNEGQSMPSMETLEMAWQSADNSYSINLTIPKFDFDSSVTLKNGVIPAFDALFAPHGMDNALAKNATIKELLISQIIQKTTFTLAEAGIEASAATVVEAIMESAMIEQKTVDLVFDKPFSFILTDGDGEVLFYGKVMKF